MPGFDDFVGQATVKDLLQSKIRLANSTGTALPHLLLCGDKEQGKVTFATCIAQEMGVPCSSARADALVATLDLTGLLSNVRARQVLIIDEVDALRPSVLDYFVQAILGDIYIPSWYHGRGRCRCQATHPADAHIQCRSHHEQAVDGR